MTKGRRETASFLLRINCVKGAQKVRGTFVVDGRQKRDNMRAVATDNIYGGAK